MSIHYQYQHHHHRRRHSGTMEGLKISDMLKTQSNASLKLIKLVLEFSQKVVSIYEQQANSLRTISETFRKKTTEALKENTLREEDVPGIVGLWKVILQETEYEAETNNVLAKTLNNNFTTPLQDCGNQQKQVMKRLVTSQEELEEKLTKSKEMLMKNQKEYHESWTKAKSRDASNKSCAMSVCYQAHNEYLLQLTAINQFLQKYYQAALPEVISDFEEFHLHLAKSIAQCLRATTKANHTKFRERTHRLELIMDTCTTVEKHKDGGRLPAPIRRAMKAHTKDSCNYIIPDHGIPAEFLTEELISNEDTRGPLTQRHESLKKEARELEVKISYSEKAIESLLEKYENLLEAQNYGRAYETKEEILKLKQAKRDARTRLAICKDQLKLFTSEVLTDAETESRLDYPHTTNPKPHHDDKRDSSVEPNGHIPDRDIQTPPLSPKSPTKRCNGTVPTNHLFQEHTFKKHTTCEHCKGVLNGLVKQCVKCTACKMAAHQKCIDQLPRCPRRVEGRGKLYRQNSFTALTNFTKKNLLRRQRSLSDVFRPSSPRDENDNKDRQKEVDFVYETIRNAKTMSGMSPDDAAKERGAQAAGASGYDYDTDGSDIKSTYTSRRSSIASTMSAMSTVSLAKSQDRRSIMKGRSISLDYTDPKLSKKGSIRKQGYAVETKRSVSLPSDPHQGRVVYQHFDAENLQDEGSERRKTYIALHDFEGGKTDDLPLKAGVIVHVLDKPSERWWKGRAMGEVGYFPCYCVEVLESWERPLRVTRSYNAAEQANQLSLKRGQIVIQISDPENGWVVVKTGQRETGRFPYQYLQPLVRKSSSST